MLTHSFTVR